MTKYARETTVPTEKTKAEIEKTLTKYGASSFASGWNGTSATLVFEMRARRIRFDLPLPQLEDEIYDSARKEPEAYRVKRREQDHRARWRGLLLIVKAKLEAVETGTRTFEQEFALDMVLPNGRTVGSAILASIDKTYDTGRLPPLLGA